MFGKLQRRSSREDAVFEHHVMEFTWLSPDQACYYLEQAIKPHSAFSRRKRGLWLAKHLGYRGRMECFVSELQKVEGVQSVRVEENGRRVILSLGQDTNGWKMINLIHQAVTNAYLDIYTNGAAMLQLGMGGGSNHRYQTLLRD